MNLQNYPARKKIAVHTAVGATMWKEIEKIAARKDIPKYEVLNALLALGLAAAKRQK